MGEPAEIIKKFTFVSKDRKETCEIKIAELLVGAYSFYVWPAAKILSQFIFYMRRCLPNKKILEIGSGSSLPGILASKLHAKVILSDSALLPKTLAHIERICLLNNLKPGQDIKIMGLTWGLIGSSVFNIEDLDLIIGSDCFYDAEVFEDIISTIAFLLERNPRATFIFTYQLRLDSTLENLLKKWQLTARNIDLESIGIDTGVDMKELMGNIEIYLLEIRRL